MPTNKSELWFAVREAIDEVSERYDVIWIKRKREIDSKFLINFIFHLVLNDRKGYNIVLSELWSDYSSKNIPTPQHNTFSASSICEARQKLPEDIFKDLNQLFLDILKSQGEHLFMQKHRIYAVDGTKVRLQKRLEKAGYNTLNTKAYYPSGLLSCLYNVENHIVHDFLFDSDTNERKSALQHIEILQENDVVIFDRGYFSYLLLHQIKAKGAHAIFRLQDSLWNKEITQLINSDAEDFIINCTPSRSVQYEIKKRGYSVDFSSIALRIIKNKIGEKVYIFGTTLLGEEYPKEIFSEIYHRRWDIEELYKISKEMFNIEELHSQRERGVKQEIYAQFVLMNMSRFLEIQGIRDHDINKKTEKFNFKACIIGIKKHLTELLFLGYAAISSAVDCMLTFIGKTRQKIRPGRKYPRLSHTPRQRWALGWTSG